MKNDSADSTSRVVRIHDVSIDKDYVQWLNEIKSRYRNAQVKAAVKVNAEQLLFNWQLGRDLVQKKAEERWGLELWNKLVLTFNRRFLNRKDSANQIYGA